jgi:iron(III) transport system ATP-binding protein
VLSIENLVKSFDSDAPRRRNGAQRVFAVNDLTFEVEDGQLFTLLGPSGCGKTTTLRSIAGLERPDLGTIRLQDRVLFSGTADGRTTNVPANERGLGMVFQSYAIWPHMTVFENVAFPLRVLPRAKRPSKSVVDERVGRVLEVMELDKLAGRQATKLSGGQQQRLALGRALVTEPPLLLLDEPLSNLDAKLRESLRFELKRMQRELGITSVYVTHDQIEALALSSVVAVMNAGEIVQMGKPRDVYENPSCRFVAEFIGTSNFINGDVVSAENGRFVVSTTDGQLEVLSDAAVPVGSDVVVSIRPEAVSVHTERPTTPTANLWSGTVETRAFLGDSVDHVVAVGKHRIRNRSNPSVSVEPGTAVYLAMDPTKLALVPVD